MKLISKLIGRCLAIALAISLPGCATRSTDWSVRVGNYTYDQAVTEMGPPERSAKLTDGSTVAEWLQRRGLKTGYVSGGFGYYGPVHRHGGFYGGPMFVAESSGPDAFIRLTFDKEGWLVTWKNVLR